MQADLEWIYEIRVAYRTTSPTIHKTSCPRFWKDEAIDFIFPAWFSYVRYFPPATEVEGRMRQVDDMALRCVEAYHYAVKAFFFRDDIKGKQNPREGNLLFAAPANHKAYEHKMRKERGTPVVLM